MQKLLNKKDSIRGDVLSIESSPNFAKDGLSFAATNLGLWRTIDSGRSWQNAFASLEADGTNVSVTAIAFSPTYSQDHMVIVGLLGGILISRDQGLTWETVFLRTPPALITGFSFHSAGIYPQTVVAGTLGDGVFLTYDRDLGQDSEWHPGNFGLLDHNVLCLASSRVSKFIYAGTESGVFQSHNSGRSWTETSFPSHLGPVLTLKVASSPTGEVVWVGTERHGVWWSSDNGHSWFESTNSNIRGPVDALYPLNDGNQTILAVIEQTLAYSADQGANWSRISIGESAINEITAISVCPIASKRNKWIVLIGREEKGVERYLITKQQYQITVKKIGSSPKSVLTGQAQFS